MPTTPPLTTVHQASFASLVSLHICSYSDAKHVSALIWHLLRPAMSTSQLVKNVNSNTQAMKSELACVCQKWLALNNDAFKKRIRTYTAACDFIRRGHCSHGDGPTLHSVIGRCHAWWSAPATVFFSFYPFSLLLSCSSLHPELSGPLMLWADGWRLFVVFHFLQDACEAPT